ncbi:DUF6660 family protein [Pedobacter sp. P351]|uniref:DUF6660 family protein n=1 Tax=Pedobacter superstes TaxID=3133441 RepID=UPI0030AC2246
MKIACLLLSLYVLLLANVPCSILDNCKDTIETSRNNTPDTNGCKHCSPFFSCSTCAGFTFSSSCCLVEIARIESTSKFYIFNQSFSNAYFDEIWQPPQIVVC